VEQFDTLVGELTVGQMLMYTAELKLPTTLSTAEKQARVDEVIAKLGLETCADTVIGTKLMRGISGGQAKRVNIALALITRPKIIFLDEPTSGLDSYMANEVARFLRLLADEGRTVVCTIHSPTSFAFGLFDDLVMLSAGQLIYGGPSGKAAKQHFEPLATSHPADGSYSLAEWLVEITAAKTPPSHATLGHAAAADSKDVERAAAGPSPTDWVRAYSTSALCAERTAELKKVAGTKTAPGGSGLGGGVAPGMWHALKTLLRYRMVTHYKSPEFLGPRIGDKILFGVLYLSLYWGIGAQTDVQSIQSTAALLYFICALCGYGAAAFVPSLTLDRPLFYRELADGCYTPVTYYLAKFIEEAVLASFTSLLFGVIVFWACSLQGSFFVFALAYYLTTMCGICLAYTVAAVAPTMDAANALLPTYVTFCMYFGGLFLLFDKIPSGWKWCSWTSFLRYSWGAMMNNQFGDPDGPGGVPAFYDEQSGAASTVLQFYAIEGQVMGSTAWCLSILAGLTLVFAACGAGALSGIRHDAR
jgi:ABC-type multidrug transport system ATPase subunit